MSTAILFSSKYGSTEEVASEILIKIEADIVDLINLKYNKPDIKDYDRLIIGLPILAENTTIEMRNFLKENEKEIYEKIIAVFILCWDTQRRDKYFEKIFGNKLHKDCIKACVGGKLDFEKMMDIEKNIIQQMTGLEKSSSNISQSEIDNFVEKINNLINK